MAIAQNFIHLASIATPGASSSVDGDNQPIPGTPVTVAGVKCRYADLSRAEIVSLTQSGITDVTSSLMLGTSPAVAQTSRIGDVTRRDGTTRASGPFEVAQVLTRESAGAEFQFCILRKLAE